MEDNFPRDQGEGGVGAGMQVGEDEAEAVMLADGEQGWSFRSLTCRSPPSLPPQTGTPDLANT